MNVKGKPRSAADGFCPRGSRLGVFLACRFYFFSWVHCFKMVYNRPVSRGRRGGRRTLRGFARGNRARIAHRAARRVAHDRLASRDIVGDRFRAERFRKGSLLKRFFRGYKRYRKIRTPRSVHYRQVHGRFRRR